MKHDPPTRYTLISKLQDSQNAEAWHEFASIYQPLIFRICQKRGLQHADATDVTQEVLARVSRAIESFDGSQQGATFRGWLYRVTRNLVIDFLRRQQKQPLHFDDANLLQTIQQDAQPDDGEEFQLEYQRQIFLVVAREVEAQVKANTWQAFWQTEVQRRDVDEVASQLGMNAGAIYVARSRILARLKKAVEKRLNETTGTFS